MTAGLEPGKPNPSAGAATCLGVRPVAKRHHKVGDARGIDLLGGTPPLGRDLVLGLVPRPAKRVEVPRQRRNGRLGLAGVQVGLNLGKRPVVGKPPPTEALRDLSGCLGVVGSTSKWKPRTIQPSGTSNAGRRPSAVLAVTARSSLVSPGSTTTRLRPCGSWRYLNRSRMLTSKPRLCDTTGTSVLRAYHGAAASPRGAPRLPRRRPTRGCRERPAPAGRRRRGDRPRAARPYVVRYCQPRPLPRYAVTGIGWTPGRMRCR
jgi:hypothetical protein